VREALELFRHYDGDLEATQLRGIPLPKPRGARRGRGR
jgi:hypothetical protein